MTGTIEKEIERLEKELKRPNFMSEEEYHIEKARLIVLKAWFADRQSLEAKLTKAEEERGKRRKC
jgi:hypothetical protein